MTQETNKQRFEIVGGPSKGDIAFAMMFKANGEHIYLTFHVVGDRRRIPMVEVRNIFLTSLKLDYDDTERENFFFDGNYCGDDRPVNGFFSTKVRKGWLEM